MTEMAFSSQCAISGPLPLPSVLPTPYGNATFVSMETFTDTFMPSLPNDVDFDAFLRKVRRIRSPASRIVTKNGRLWGYSARTPSSSQSSRVFSHIGSCIARLAKRLPRKTVAYSFQDEAQFGHCDLESLPAAYFHAPRSEVSPTMSWSRIAVSGAYELCDSFPSFDRNVSKITRYMSRCMSEDPRRRFTYGFTVEDTSMRLWYCDRAHIIASAPFNFVTDYRTLLRFFLACMYAEPDVLGYDPTMTPRRELDGTVQYDIAVTTPSNGTQVYRTIGSLYDGGSDTLFGRATRVWEAMRLNEAGEMVGEPVALKDCWVDHFREREGDISTRIRQSSTSLESEDHELLNEMLLTVLDHGDVRIAGLLDCTRPIPAEACKGTFGQVHYRIVHAEVGIPLREETSLQVVYQALVDVCGALYGLHMCGWIHGDISSNNILLYRGKAKIADLEYAKQRGEIEEHDKIGTPFFIPVEVQFHKYIFSCEDTYKEIMAVAGHAAESLSPASSSSSDEADQMNTENPGHRRPTPKLVHKMPFRYNPLHDLESLWWISTYFVLARAIVDAGNEAVPTSEVDLDQVQRQREAAERLFCKSLERYDVMIRDGPFLDELWNLHPAVRRLWGPLDEARQALTVGFRHIEQDMATREFDPPVGVYNCMQEQFFRIAGHLEDQDIKVAPFPGGWRT